MYEFTYFKMIAKTFKISAFQNTVMKIITLLNFAKIDVTIETLPVSIQVCKTKRNEFLKISKITLYF